MALTVQAYDIFPDIFYRAFFDDHLDPPLYLG